MKWVVCQYCRAEYPVSTDDNPSEWEDPCEVCGHKAWEVEMNLLTQSQFRILKQIEHGGRGHAFDKSDETEYARIVEKAFERLKEKSERKVTKTEHVHVWVDAPRIAKHLVGATQICSECHLVRIASE